MAHLPGAFVWDARAIQGAAVQEDLKGKVKIKGRRGEVLAWFLPRAVSANQTESMSFLNELSYCSSSPLSHSLNGGFVLILSQNRGSLWPSPSFPGQICFTSSVWCLWPFSVPLSLPGKKKKKTQNSSSSISAPASPPVSIEVGDVGGESTALCRQRRWDVIDRKSVV